MLWNTARGYEECLRFRKDADASFDLCRVCFWQVVGLIFKERGEPPEGGSRKY